MILKSASFHLELCNIGYQWQMSVRAKITFGDTRTQVSMKERYKESLTIVGLHLH
jgi:hypothetical protein